MCDTVRICETCDCGYVPLPAMTLVWPPYRRTMALLPAQATWITLALDTQIPTGLLRGVDIEGPSASPGIPVPVAPHIAAAIQCQDTSALSMVKDRG